MNFTKENNLQNYTVLRKMILMLNILYKIKKIVSMNQSVPIGQVKNEQNLTVVLKALRYRGFSVEIQEHYKHKPEESGYPFYMQDEDDNGYERIKFLVISVK